MTCLLSVVLSSFVLVYLVDFFSCQGTQLNTPTATLHVLEEQPPNTLVGSINRTGNLKLISADKYPTNNFNLSSDGKLYTKRVIDREKLTLTEQKEGLKFSVGVNLDSDNFKVISVTVLVVDVNDNKPRFSKQTQNISLSESAPIGHSISIMIAQDLDFGSNGDIQYTLTSSKFQYFSLSYKKGLLQLITMKSLDRESETDFVSLNISACDMGKPPLCSYLIVNIHILDANDNSPTFDREKYSASVYENATIGQVVTTVHATDADTGPNGKIRYSVFKSGGKAMFRISDFKNPGDVAVSGHLDAEKQYSYTIVVIAEDGGQPSKKSTAEVHISVMDCNDNKPEVVIQKTASHGSWDIIEGAPTDTEVAKVIVRDFDKDPANNKVSLVLGDGSKFLKLDEYMRVSDSEVQYKLLTKVVIDREVTGTALKYELVAQDNGLPILKTVIDSEIYVEDVNDNAPEFQSSLYKFTVNESQSIGSVVGSVKALDKDYNSSITYSLYLDRYSWFSINRVTGDISVKDHLDREDIQVMNLTILASDNGSPSFQGNCTVQITILDANDNKPYFQDASLQFGILENNKNGDFIGKNI